MKDKIREIIEEKTGTCWEGTLSEVTDQITQFLIKEIEGMKKVTEQGAFLVNEESYNKALQDVIDRLEGK